VVSATSAAHRLLSYKRIVCARLLPTLLLLRLRLLLGPSLTAAATYWLLVRP